MSSRTFRMMFHTSNTATGCPYKFRSRRTTSSSDVGPRFGPFCRGRRIQMSGHPDLGTSGHCITCMWPYCNANYFCGRHLWCWRTLLGECSVWASFTMPPRSTTTSFVLLELGFQLRVFEMAHLLVWKTELSFFLCLFNDLFFCSWLTSLAMLAIFRAFPHSWSTAAWASGIFVARPIEMNFCTRL